MRKLCGMGLRPWRAITVAALGALAFFVVGAGASVGDQVSCGDTITQDTKLDHDLIDCPGNGIVIGADNITLDLNGHMIDGRANAACCTYGVLNPALFPGHDGVAITGGTIREFSFGVAVEEARGNVLRRLAVTDTLVAVILGASDDSVIELNHVSDAKFSGLSVSGSGNILIRDNSIVRSACGLSLTALHGESVIEHNTISDNGICGLHLSGNFSGHHRVAHNLLQRNAIGIQLVDSTGTEIVRNSISDGSTGISLGDNAYRNRIERNSSSHNEFGIKLATECHDNLISGNFVTNNSRSGIEFAGATAAANDNNQVIDNIALSNGEDGIAIGTENLENLLSGNIAHRNGEDGIDVDSPTNTLTDNVANRNRDLGIEAVPGAIDGGGNRARGNGNPLQCLNVDCS